MVLVHRPVPLGRTLEHPVGLVLQRCPSHRPEGRSVAADDPGHGLHDPLEHDPVDLGVAAAPYGDPEPAQLGGELDRVVQRHHPAGWLDRRQPDRGGGDSRRVDGGSQLRREVGRQAGRQLRHRTTGGVAEPGPPLPDQLHRCGLQVARRVGEARCRGDRERVQQGRLPPGDLLQPGQLGADQLLLLAHQHQPRGVLEPLEGQPSRVVEAEELGLRRPGHGGARRVAVHRHIGADARIGLVEGRRQRVVDLDEPVGRRGPAATFEAAEQVVEHGLAGHEPLVDRRGDLVEPAGPAPPLQETAGHVVLLDDQRHHRGEARFAAQEVRERGVAPALDDPAADIGTGRRRIEVEALAQRLDQEVRPRVVDVERQLVGQQRDRTRQPRRRAVQQDLRDAVGVLDAPVAVALGGAPAEATEAPQPRHHRARIGQDGGADDGVRREVVPGRPPLRATRPHRLAQRRDERLALRGVQAAQGADERAGVASSYQRLDIGPLHCGTRHAGLPARILPPDPAAHSEVGRSSAAFAPGPRVGPPTPGGAAR